MPFVRAIRLSIRAKVLLLALGLALTPLVIVSLLGLTSLDTARETAKQVSTDALREQAVSNLKERAADKARLYNTILNNVKQQVEGVAAYASALTASGPPPAGTGRVWISPDGPTPASEQDYAATVARARQFIPLLSSVVQRNQLIELGYIGLEDGGVVAFDHDIVDVLIAIKPFDVRTRPWYIKARDSGHTVWTDLYVDANTKQLTISCATPFYDDRGRFLGVVGFDMLLDTIKEDILKLDMGPAGYAFLINDQGEYLVQPDLEVGEVSWNDSFITENLRQSPDPKLRAVAEGMIRHEQGIEQLFYKERNVYLAYAPVDSTGWSVGIVIPEDQIIKPAAELGARITERQEQLRNQVLLLLALGLVAVPALGAVLSVLITRPLRTLQAGAQRIAAGDLSYRLPLNSNDEIGDLVLSFNVMTDALRQKVAELEDNLRQLATLNEISNRFKAILALPQLLDGIPHAACESFGFERAALYLLDGDLLRVASASFGPNGRTAGGRVHHRRQHRADHHPQRDGRGRYCA